MAVFAQQAEAGGNAEAAPAQADVQEAIRRVSAQAEKKGAGTIGNKDISALVSGLRSDAFTAKVCAELLEKVAKRRPELFTEKAVVEIFAGFRNRLVAAHCGKIIANIGAGDSQIAEKCRALLFDGLEKPEISGQCAKAIASLARIEPNIFTRKMAETLSRGLDGKESADGCALALAALACWKPELAGFCLASLIGGLEKAGAKFCADALANIAGKRPELLYLHVDALAASLENRLAGAGCARALGFLALADRSVAVKCVDALLGGLGFEWAGAACAEALRNAAGIEPKLFTEERVGALVSEMKSGKVLRIADVLEKIAAGADGKIAKKCLAALFDGAEAGGEMGEECIGCIARLAWLAAGQPQAAYAWMDELLVGLGKEGGIGAACANALAHMVEKDERSRKRLLDAFEGRGDYEGKALGEKERGVLEKRNLSGYHLQHAQELKGKFGIDSFTRYPEPILRGMLSGVRDEKRPLAVVAYAKTDWNGYFYDAEVITELYKAGYQVVVFECASDEEFIKKMEYITGRGKDGREIRERDVMGWGQVSLLGIEAHGRPTGAEWAAGAGPEGELERGDALLTALPSFLVPGGNAQIVLNSCSTGDVEVLDNLAAAISGKVKYAKVFAPVGDVFGLSDIKFGRDGKGMPYIISIDFKQTRDAEYISGKPVNVR